ncbi:hypothetical protein CDAR_108281 [Caerostris darwini]|uniref:Uncharacterized protein n=1 Tax=Caerostris darwini TaxID=1538125 RepID=A0AAV4TF82_9ARAC|nr:hypothetical protein CDAR_108281 [Caerostris darwini]
MDAIGQAVSNLSTMKTQNKVVLIIDPCAAIKTLGSLQKSDIAGVQATRIILDKLLINVYNASLDTVASLAMNVLIDCLRVTAPCPFPYNAPANNSLLPIMR